MPTTTASLTPAQAEAFVAAVLAHPHEADTLADALRADPAALFAGLGIDDDGDVIDAEDDDPGEDESP